MSLVKFKFNDPNGCTATVAVYTSDVQKLQDALCSPANDGIVVKTKDGSFLVIKRNLMFMEVMEDK